MNTKYYIQMFARLEPETPWQVAPMESFWGTLKNELVHHRRYETRAEAIREISEYIDIFYNRYRRHSRLGYLSPAVFTQQFYAKRLAA